MEVLERMTDYFVPIIIIVVLICGIKEKKDIFKLFINGAEEGVKTTIKLIPFIIAFFFFSSMLISSNIVDFIFDSIKINNSVKDVFLVSTIKAISGSAGTSLGIELLKNVGIDSNLGLVICVILGSTETTLYVISMYLGKYNGKKIYPICLMGLLCDLFVFIFSFILVLTL